jgi:hypothetical protein
LAFHGVAALIYALVFAVEAAVTEWDIVCGERDICGLSGVIMSLARIPVASFVYAGVQSVLLGYAWTLELLFRWYIIRIAWELSVVAICWWFLRSIPGAIFLSGLLYAVRDVANHTF